MFAGLALLSSLMWGTADFLGGKLSKKFHPMAVTGASQAFGLIVGLSMLALTSGFRRPDLALSGYAISGLIAGLAGFIGLISYYAGLATGKMGVVAPITSLSAVIPLLYGIYQGDQPSTLQILGMAVALLGCFLASGPEVRSGLSARPIVLGFLTAIMFGVALVFMARGSKQGALLTMTTMRCETVTISLLIALGLRTYGGFSKSSLFMLIVIGSTDFLANYTLGLASTKGLVSVAMVLGSLFPVVTTLLAYRFLHERLQRAQYLGVVFAVAGIALISGG
jgi:drug/metabolite transporter (DMT)-like permease